MTKGRGLVTRRDRLLEWMRSSPAHQGLTTDQIHTLARHAGLYDNHTTLAAPDWKTTRDLHELLHDGQVITDNPWTGRWWPNPTESP